MLNNDTKEATIKNIAKSADIKNPPDGGWGWAVVIASFIAYMITDGCTFSFGIMYAELLHYFNESKAATAWVNSLYVSFPLLAGPVAGVAINRYGCRTVTIAGSLLSGLGFVLSFFATNIWTLYFTLGLMAGIGTAFIYVPCVIVVAYYFQKKRAFATGVALAGTGIGTFAFAPLIEFLNDEYGWRGTMLILGGLLFNICVCGFVYIPLENDVAIDGLEENFNSEVDFEHKVENEIYVNYSLKRDSCYSQSVVVLPTFVNQVTSENSKTPVSGSSFCNLKSDMNSSFLAAPLHNLSTYLVSNKTSKFSLLFKAYTNDKVPLNRSYSHSCPDLAIMRQSKCKKDIDAGYASLIQKAKQICVDMFDLELLRNFMFVYFTLSCLFLYISYDVPYVYVPVMTETMIGRESSHVIAISGLTNTVGQIVIGYVGDKMYVSSLFLYSVLTAFAGISTAFVPLLSTYWQLCIYGALYGLFISGTYALTTIVLVDMFGIERLTNSYGMVLLGQGIVGLIGPPIAGAISDYTGSFSEAFYLSGILMTLSGVMLFASPCLQQLAQ